MVSSATVARRFYELLSAGLTDDALALVSSDYVGHGLGAGGGPESLREDLTTWFAAFPDLDIAVDDVIGDDDRVAVRLVLSGTHSGTFAGVAATDRHFRIVSTDVLRMDAGRIVEAWTRWDVAGLLVQVGALPQNSYR